MARNPGTPQPPSGPSQPGDGGPVQEPWQPERYGILMVSRHRKDDGRALLLYTREEGETE